MLKSRAQMALIASLTLLFLPAAAGAAGPSSKSAANPPVPLPMDKPHAIAVAGLVVSDAPRPGNRPANIELPPHPLATGLLSRKDLGIYKAAFAAAEAQDWTRVRFLVSEATYKLPAKILDWRYFTTYDTQASFNEITAFIRENPHWPYQVTLRQRAEQALAVPVPPQKTVDWFTVNPPRTGTGMYRYGEALRFLGRDSEGRDWIRRAWREGDLPELIEKEILREAGSFLDRADHEARLDHLLWERNSSAAERVLPRVSADVQKLARARLALMTGTGDVDALVRAVPERLQNDPGLLFERTRWRRVRSLYPEAQELLFGLDAEVPHAEKWWLERHIQARELLTDGDIARAYQLASRHGLKSGANFASAEWLSGWIALRFMHDPETALQHFGTLYENVGYPISRSRGAYWIARAQAARGDAAMAEHWYRTAAQYYTTYYGQMALHELGERRLPAIPATTAPRGQDATIPGMEELYLVIRQLAELGEERLTRPFLLHLTDKATREAEYATLAALANSVNRPDFAIAIAKQASQSGTEIIEINWPTPSLALQNPPVEEALMLAIARQESSFAPDAISRAGARGLMQLMPGTAEQVSRKLNVSYSQDLLIADPAYNVLLGSNYLASLIAAYNGSYVLAIAAYNAGPSNVNRWISEHGDPRTGAIDSIDWIEFIPFGETRNYVQRVIENLQIYRERLAEREGKVLQIAEDINRGNPAD
ncbi:lytic transglycosylase domain-containing protein [Sneathiella sp.]|uniref:lytic transglycosylase domain-containing protein n=1 Tax=Sneathiella sp. TaxID=1964365 RepID=UPI002FE2B4DF